MLKKRDTGRARLRRWVAYLLGCFLIGLLLLPALIMVGAARLTRRIKLSLACSGLEPDQTEIVQRIERRHNPYHDEPSVVSLHEVMGEARQNAIAPWRLRLVM